MTYNAGSLRENLQSLELKYLKTEISAFISLDKQIVKVQHF